MFTYNFDLGETIISPSYILLFLSKSIICNAEEKLISSVQTNLKIGIGT